MARKLYRDDFNQKTKDALAKRAGYKCSICKCQTIGPSDESAYASASIGVAAHISAAAPGGPRYSASLSAAQRAHISNGIWLCQNDAALIDRDSKTWTVPKLIKVKGEHEAFIKQALERITTIDLGEKRAAGSITPKEFAFIEVQALHNAYKDFIRPILKDNTLSEDTTLGMLMCGAEPGSDNRGEPSLTVLVNSEWLQWILKGQAANFDVAQSVPHSQIYGRVPGWPDTFFEFLTAMVQSKSVFEWQRHPDGYLQLVQQPKRANHLNQL